VFNGLTGRQLHGPRGDFFPYDGTNGVFVAAGDVNGDGHDDIIVGPDAGMAPLVKVFDGKTGQLLTSFMADTPEFMGGIRVAAGDVNGDGKADVITGLGAGDLPLVRVFSGADQSLLASFLVGDPNFSGGVFVAAGDVDGSGRAEVIASQDAGGSPLVDVFSLGKKNRTVVRSFLAEDSSFTGGVRLAVVENGGQADIVTVDGPGSSPLVRVFDATTLQAIDTFFATDPNFSGGLFVGGGLHS
jgi:hypothetical protein